MRSEPKHSAKVKAALATANNYFDELQRQLFEIISRHYANPARYPSQPSVTIRENTPEEKEYPVFSRYFKEDNLVKPFVSFPSPEGLTDQIVRHLNTVSPDRKQTRFGEDRLFNNGYTPSYFLQGIQNIETKQHSNAANLELLRDVAESGLRYLRTDPNEGPKVGRLIKRLEAVKQLKEKLNANIDDAAAQNAVSDTLKTCKENKPEWSERPFLRKLADVFTLGLTYFFSTNSTERFIKTMDEQKDSAPKPGK
jgi:hypothetical protein